MRCTYKPCNKQYKALEGKKFCTKTCKDNHNTTKRRRALKRKAVDFLGGKCMRCGYSGCMAALQFHHRNKRSKKFTISAKGTIKSWPKLMKELKKCDLICTNCHIATHNPDENPVDNDNKIE